MPATINGLRLLEATIHEPIRGVWLATVEVDHDEALTGSVTIDVDGLTSWVGTVIPTRAGLESGRSKARVLGGAGALGTTLPARGYTNVRLSIILDHLIAAAGETLADDAIDLSLEFVPRWVRCEGLASDALDALADNQGLTWRTLRDGTIWIGTDTYPEIEPALTREDFDPRSNTMKVAPAEGAPFYPGVSYDGRQVTQVTTRITGRGLRQTLSFGDDRLFRVMRGLVERMVGNALTYGKLFPARVVSQNADGTLDVQPDSSTIAGGTGAGLSRVPIVHGLPGASVEVPAGARVHIGFLEGDPTKPRALLWDDDTDVDRINLGAGVRQVVREGDTITVGASTGPVVITAPYLGTKSKLWA